MEQQKILPQIALVHKQDLFKIFIPINVEKKIRTLCKHIWDVEWSGVLFYKIEGNFEDKSLIIKCVDILQMDEGTSSYTEFDMSSDVATYIVDHPELMDGNTFQGLIHSHNNMNSFFSGTDTNTLKSEGNDMPHFVSLIVNNAGKYTAAITRKYKVSQIVTENYTYNSWNEENKTGSREFTAEKEVIEWFNLDIQFEDIEANFEEDIITRIKEIKDFKKQKESLKTRITPYTGNTKYQNSKSGYVPIGVYGKSEGIYDYDRMNDYASKSIIQKENMSYNTAIERGNKIKQSELPFEVCENSDLEIPYGICTLKEDTITTLIKQLITASVIIVNSNVVDINKWVNSMDELYRKRFSSVKEFEYFASNYIDFLLNNISEEDSNGILDTTELTAIAAYEITQRLVKLPKNPWLNCYLTLLDDYIL